ncbi:MAG: Flp pilus assembly protein CpaB [Actinobacteria bacterium]|nr:Flp pilus assembly protein CpaB [Actinomycetota bacterium]MBU1944512.1 Flp pilus assembly protein CpaB [Actinomycetota bacterium]MBU2689065.1 Flp pilus assembly protein CpaB [Actinomycetota bacterium]
MKIANVLRSHPALNTALGVAFAALAVLLMLGYVSRLAGASGGREVSVPIASRDIDVGVRVTREMVTTSKVPRRYVVPGSMKGPDPVIGGTAVRFIARGEPFTESSISGAGGGNTLASRIPQEFRAYSLSASRGCATGPFIRSGDRVDVLATRGDPPSTSTILRDRLVLTTTGGSSGDLTNAQEGFIKVTLLVSPGEAEVLAQAECEAEISVSLCPPAPSPGTAGKGEAQER